MRTLRMPPEVSLPTTLDVERYASKIKSAVSLSSPHRGSPLATALSSVLGAQLLKLISLVTIYTLRTGRVPAEHFDRAIAAQLDAECIGEKPSAHGVAKSVEQEAATRDLPRLPAATGRLPRRRTTFGAWSSAAAGTGRPPTSISCGRRARCRFPIRCSASGRAGICSVCRKTPEWAGARRR